jgi:hypothetical protein
MPRKKRTPTSANDVDNRKLFMFLEELSWLLSSYSDLNLKTAVRDIRNRLFHEFDAASAVGSYASPNPNKQFLVGVLPRVLNDEALFPTNEDISEFALSVMKVRIPRYHKKSKYELIGHIVCQTNELDERGLSKLVHALAVLTGGDEKVRKLIKQRKDQNFGWNAIIQELAAGKADEQRNSN